MGYIVMAYTEEGNQEYILPNLYDADYEILLKKQLFGIQKDIRVLLEIVDGRWSFVQCDEYHLLTKESMLGFGISLEDGQVYYLRSHEGIEITMVIISYSEAVPSFLKYHISGTNQITVGNNAGNIISYDFKGYISQNHCMIFRYQSQWVLQDFSKNGTYLNGKRVHGQTYLDFGDRINLFGMSIIFLESCIAVCTLSGNCVVDENILPYFYPGENADLTRTLPEKTGKEYFKRSPRMMENLYTEEIEIEAPPQLNKTVKKPLLLTIGPSFTMAIPMMLGCVMAVISAKSRGAESGIYMFTGMITAVSSAILGVMWALINLRYAGREEERNEQHRYNAYGEHLLNITEYIRQKYDENVRAMFRMYPSGQECAGIGHNDVRLWNRNERHQDFMTVRLGTGTVPFQAEIKIPKERFTLIKDDLSEKPAVIRETYQMLHNVPVCLDIRDKGVIGVIGGREKNGAYPVVYSMIAQTAASNCYTDVKMVFLYREERAEFWSFAKWLPHVWSEDHKTRFIASNKSEVGDILYELSRVFRMRTEEQTEKKEDPLPHYLFFIDDTELLEGELLEHMILNPWPEYGITTILLTERYEELPNSCENIIQNDENQSRFFHVFEKERESENLICEGVTCEQLENLSRRLCDIEVNEVKDNGEIPNTLDFFEMFGVSSLEQLNVIERWKKNRNYENMRVPIGQKNGGAVCYLDIHEKYHGPHGLVAGTTGSGKSETLQTYILSLAVNFSPDDIAFFIIDFKGGGMANLFSGLPHMVGQISNLSGNQVRRAMISIKSENMRRQRIFAEHNVNNINAYTRLFKSREAEYPVPHLFIIIDEFAELKREEPEFMKELISVAQVGRSLGVHLILATQKPSGTVDDNIWSNSKFRLCLRVQDRQDSNDMLHKPDAAYITQAGRGYLQVGNDEIYEQFQSGYSGAEYIDDPKKNCSPVAVMVTLTGKEAVSGNNTRKKNFGKKKISQLEAVVGYLQKTAQKQGYGQSMLLWLPVLPEELYLEQLEGYQEEIFKDGCWKEHHGKWQLETLVGLYDDPANQAQKPLKLSFSEGGHLAVCGTIATGKSTFLQTFLYGMIHRYNPQELNFYILDYSSRMLLPYEKAPHCGGVMIDTDIDKVNKFFYMLEEIIIERKQLFKGGSFSQYIQSGRGKRISPILVVIDNYANFREKTSGKYDENMLRLSREGIGYGIFLVISSGGFGTNEIPSRIGDNIKTVISLEMGDKFKYSEVLRTTRVETLPEADVKGRGLAWVEGSVLEFQTALPLAAEDVYKCSECIEEVCMGMAEAWKGSSAKQIPVIPEKPTFPMLKERQEYQELAEGRRYLPFAYLSRDASVYGVDLWFSYCYMIQGRSRSGKKNVMKLLMAAASMKKEARICVIDFGEQELKKISEQMSAEYITGENEIYEFFKSTVPIFKERNVKKHELLSTGTEETELAEIMNREVQIYIFISDIVDFVQTAYKTLDGKGSISAYLENITEKGSFHGIYFIGLLNPEQASLVSGKKLYRNMVSYRTGIHLGGNVTAQRVFQFQNIPFQEQSKTSKPGIGLVSGSEDLSAAEEVIIPLVKGNIG